MATPNQPNPQKKTNGPPAKGNPGAKPAAPAGKVPPKPAAAAKPAADKAPAEKTPAKKPAAPKRTSSDSGGRRKIGQVLIDLGYIDEDQLWEILDEAKSSGQRTGEVAVARGLINEDQLLKVLAEQAGLKVVSLEDVKPSPEAITAVPETMATVYKVLPLSHKDNVLTVV